MKLFAKIDGRQVETTDAELIAKLRAEVKPSDLEDFEGYVTWLQTANTRTVIDSLNDYARYLGINVSDIKSNHDYRKQIVVDTLLERALKRLGGDRQIIIESGFPDDDNRMEKCVSSHSLSSLLLEIHYQDQSFLKRSNRYNFAPSPLRTIETLDDVYAAQDTGDVYIFFIGTVDEYEKKKQESRRKELEELASKIAQKHGVKVNTIEFLFALDKEIAATNRAREEWNNPEVRMEEWAACQYAGVGTDVYFDDLNFENGRINSRHDDAEDIRAWVSENCPLLFAQYQEQCERASAKDELDSQKRVSDGA